MIIMLIQCIVPLLPIKNLEIYDIAEETDASIPYQAPNKRFHNILHFVVSGEGVYRVHSKSETTPYELSPNTLFACYSSDVIFYQSKREKPLHYYWIGFSGEESEKILEYLGFSNTRLSLPVSSSGTECIINAFDALIQSWKNEDKYELLAALYTCIHTLKKELHTLTPPISDVQNNILLQAQHYIQDNLHNNIKVQDIVSYLHIDRSYFNKIFKKQFNLTPHQYLLQCRLTEAENLLSISNFTIQEIVDFLNFPNIYSFSRIFKKRFNLSPSAYKKKLKAVQIQKANDFPDKGKGKHRTKK